MLSDVQCRNAKKAEKAYKLADGGGLYLFVSASGFRSWRMKYRFAGKEKLLTFGGYPEVSLTEARDRRDQARRLLRDHRDPAVDRAQRAAAATADAGLTFKAIATTWHKTNAKRWAPRYADHIWSRLDRDVFPEFGHLPITAVTVPMVLNALRKIEARGAHEMAHRVRQHMSGVFLHAVAAGHLQTDPAATVVRVLVPAQGNKLAAAVKIEQARTVLRLVEARDCYFVTKLASRLLALTAVRPGVVRLADPKEFEGLDTAEPIWRIPPAKLKLARDRKANAAFELVVPLSAQAVDVVRTAIDVIARGDLLFPSVISPRRPISDSTLSGLYLDAKLPVRHVPHGWRSSFSTVMNELAALNDRPSDRQIIDMMLAHVQAGVEAVYNRASYMARRRAIAQEWADMLMAGFPSAAELLPPR